MTKLIIATAIALSTTSVFAAVHEKINLVVTMSIAKCAPNTCSMAPTHFESINVELKDCNADLSSCSGVWQTEQTVDGIKFAGTIFVSKFSNRYNGADHVQYGLQASVGAVLDSIDNVTTATVQMKSNTLTDTLTLASKSFVVPHSSTSYSAVLQVAP